MNWSLNSSMIRGGSEELDRRLGGLRVGRSDWRTGVPGTRPGSLNA